MSRILVAVVTISIGLASSATVRAQPLLQRLEQRLRNAVPPQPLPVPAPGETAELESPDGAGAAHGRAQLGIHVDDVTPSSIAQYGLSVRRGALITGIQRGSVADQAGLPMGGVIVAIDGFRIDSAAELVGRIRAALPGEKMELSYFDGSKLFRRRVQLGPTSLDVPGQVPAPPDRPIPPATVAGDPFSDPNRPLLNRLGRVIDGFSAAAPLETPDVRPAVGEVQMLRDQVTTLQRQVEQLTARLSELEKRLAAEE